MGERVMAGDVELWVERRGQGPDVLLIAGLGDPAEAWQPQLDGLADRYRLTAFDNRGAARTPLPEGPLSASSMADDVQQSVEAFQAQVDVCLSHDTVDRLSEIAAPTLFLSGEFDVILPPRFGQAVAAAIPGARFEVMAGEAHQPFQEVPDEFNARIDAFWREVEARG
jgi:pimeloyl-ACP methyl ester carboxylesterase